MTALSPLALPTRDEDWAGWLDERGRGSLRSAGDQIAALKVADGGDTAILQLWNDASISLANASAITSLLSSVHPDAAVIELAEAIEVEVRRFTSDLLLDRAVFDQLSSLAQEHLDAGARRVLQDALRSFRRSGVDQDDPTRER